MNEDLTPLECEYCGKLFTSVRGKTKHEKRHQFYHPLPHSTLTKHRNEEVNEDQFHNEPHQFNIIIEDADSEDEDYLPVPNQNEEEQDEEVLRRLLQSLETSNEQLKVFGLYAFFIYFRLTQRQMRGLVSFLNSPIFNQKIKFNVKKVFTNVQQLLTDAKVQNTPFF